MATSSSIRRDQIQAIKAELTKQTGYEFTDRDGGAWTHIFTATGPGLPKDWVDRSMIIPWESFEVVLKNSQVLFACLPFRLVKTIPYGCKL